MRQTRAPYIREWRLNIPQIHQRRWRSLDSRTEMLVLSPKKRYRCKRWDSFNEMYMSECIPLGLCWPPQVLCSQWRETNNSGDF